MSQTTAAPVIPQVSFSEYELCAHWSKCPKSLFNMRRAGKIPFFRQGMQIRYLLSDIEAFERKHPTKKTQA